MKRGTRGFMAGSALTALTALVSTPLSATDPARALHRGDHGLSWRAEVTLAGDRDDVNMVLRHGSVRIRETGPRDASLSRPSGSVTFPPRTLPLPVNRVRATVNARLPAGASVQTAVRGRSSRGWTEWREIAANSPAELPRRVRKVQVRLTLRANENGRSPAVSELRLYARAAPAPQRVPRATPRTYTVFATRQGLVGETTANGHVVGKRDHFVALPSGRSLSPRGQGDYSVKVCSPDTRRCAFAAVWDVGPWNIDDDYWNPASVRENWTDLPQGMPQAEAAYLNGYNGGRDGFGRRVLNPAGIDLADGTFWDAVGLNDNAWVNVTYLWTGTYPATGQVRTAGAPLRLRSEPTTNSRVVGLAGRRAMVPIHCQTYGETVSGTQGTTELWNRVGRGMYVSDAYTQTGSDGRVAPLC